MTAARLNHIVRECNVLLSSERLLKQCARLWKDSATRIQIKSATSLFLLKFTSFDGAPCLFAPLIWSDLVFLFTFSLYGVKSSIELHMQISVSLHADVGSPLKDTWRKHSFAHSDLSCCFSFHILSPHPFILVWR